MRLSARFDRGRERPRGTSTAPAAGAAPQFAERTLLRLLLIYALASLVHFAHNGLELRHYPNMPAWLSASGVMGAWLALSALGLGGYWLYRRGRTAAGLALIVLYGLCAWTRWRTTWWRRSRRIARRCT